MGYVAPGPYVRMMPFLDFCFLFSIFHFFFFMRGYTASYRAASRHAEKATLIALALVSFDRGWKARRPVSHRLVIQV